MASSARKLLLAGLAVSSATVTVAACGSVAPTPQIDGLVPSVIRYDQNVQLTIVGSGFAQRTIPDAQNPSKSALASPSVRIDGRDDFAVTFVSATALTVAFGRPIERGLISRDDVEVTVTNPEGEPVVFSPLRVLGPRFVVIGTAAEAAPGDANVLAVPFRVLDQDMQPVPIIDEPLWFTVGVQPTSATAAIATLGVTSSEGILQVGYDFVGPVDIAFGAADPPWDALDGTGGRAVFIPGPPAVVRILDRTGPQNTDVLTWAVLEDEWGNPTSSSSQIYQGTPFATNCATGATINPSTIAIATNSSSAGFTVNCGVAATVNVSIFESGTSTGWITSSGRITFQP